MGIIGDRGLMPLINFTKKELQYIEVALFMLSQEKPGELLHSEESVKNIQVIMDKVEQLLSLIHI